MDDIKKRFLKVLSEIKKTSNISDFDQEIDIVEEIERDNITNLTQDMQSTDDSSNDGSKKDKSKDKSKDKTKDKKRNSIHELEELINETFAYINHLEERNQITIADGVNLKKKLDNDALNIKKYAGERLASEIIPAIDMLRKVVQTPNSNEAVANYLKGFEMILSSIDNGLSNAGVVMINSKKGDDFDQHLHEAIEIVKTEEFGPNKITEVVSNGYKLHDRVIIFSKVKVSGQ